MKKAWREMNADEKIERLNRDLSIVWWLVFGGVGMGLALLFIWIFG